MHTQLLQINKDGSDHCQVASTLSFRPFLDYLKSRIATEDAIKAEFYRFVLDRFEKEAPQDICLRKEDSQAYRDLLELVYMILTPIVADEKEVFWALSTPIPDQIFFSTSAFHSLFQHHEGLKGQEAPGAGETFKNHQLRFIYRLILKRFYNYTSVTNDAMIKSYTDPVSNITQFYRIENDSRFVDIHFDGDLPELNFEVIGAQISEGSELELLNTLLPLSRFSFEGFSVITLTDVSVQHAIDTMRNALVSHQPEETQFASVIQSFKTIAGNGNIEFGLLPFLTINGELVFEMEARSQSFLMDSAMKAELSEENFCSLFEKYLANPKPIFFNKLNADTIMDPRLLKVFAQMGVYAYALFPVFHNKQLAGLMEVYSKEALVFDERLISRIQAALPLLGQLFKHTIDEFNARLDSVLKDKFTSLQPSVQWKFNETAWNYLKKTRDGEKMVEIDTVTFKDMYPLFGAIDIRNSTAERNIALQDDLKALLEQLVKTLRALKKTIPLNLTDKLIFNSEEWLMRIGNLITTNDEIMLTNFLNEEAHSFLRHFKEIHPETKDIVNAYFAEIDEETGIAFKHRRNLETSMQLINSSVSHYLENAQQQLQRSYPCYFGKFRTDGIEYDIYIGQAIAPERPFDVLYLKNIRLWQLTSMVDIARLTRNLAGKMPRLLETTQLIFVHSSHIDISFRNDERRFDVEGAYNIRYEVIKKRIDKVLVKNTSERLTQPGKIALVYFNQAEAAEYEEYINYLHEQQLLEGAVEHLELEELQGVSGLKAIRVSVNYHTGTEEQKQMLKKFSKGMVLEHN
ncbi:GAF domain-containing protein [Hufsiella ginkgonis]|uniref:GAF domain-containing protein n=1 Tax=Hufsiella ginkgonis TaxID=2695274 RepID=A0A7K1Y296_9SPHI|nr:GAF domain-containing protein [Hufsiella ginkgonis]MXV16796.1 GAF domain-containing protein [Hufsiella ginkgonis]